MSTHADWTPSPVLAGNERGQPALSPVVPEPLGDTAPVLVEVDAVGQVAPVRPGVL